MSRIFKYQVCRMERTRVTFVNGRWQGLQIDNADAETLYNSCPLIWEYLAAAGREGWELVATTPPGYGGEISQAAGLLFLKKEESSAG